MKNKKLGKLINSNILLRRDIGDNLHPFKIYNKNICKFDIDKYDDNKVYFNDFCNSNHYKSDLSYCNIKKCNIASTNLSKSKFVHDKIIKSTLTNVDLSDCIFIDTIFYNSVFDKVKFKWVIFDYSNKHNAFEFKNVFLNTKINNIEFNNSILKSINFANTVFNSPPVFANSYLKYIYLYDVDISNAIFDGSVINLESFYINENTKMENIDFSSVILKWEKCNVTSFHYDNIPEVKNIIDLLSNKGVKNINLGVKKI